MPHDGTHLEPTVEHRADGTVVPTHRWMQTSKSVPPSEDRSGLADATHAVAGETYVTVEHSSSQKSDNLAAGAILGAVQVIAARCDGAHEKDSEGFNAGDTVFGRALAFVPPENWDPATTWEAHRMLRKYRDQLSESGVPYDSLPVPDKPDASEDDRVVGKRGRQLVREPYNAHQKELKKAERDNNKQQQREESNRAARSIVFDDRTNEFVVQMDRKDHDARDALKAQVPGRQFDWDTKAWTVPASSAEPLMVYANEWEFQVAGGVQTRFDEVATQTRKDMEDPDYHKKQNGTVTLKGDKLVIETPYDYNMVEVIKGLPGRRWDGTNNIVDISPEALSFAEEYDLYVEDGAVGQVQTKAEVEGRLTELSNAHTAELHIDGFNVELFDYQKAGVAYALEAKRTFIADQMGLGKGGTDSTKILTPTGWITFADVKVGDRVVGSDGKTHQVTGVYPRGKLDVYRVTMNDNTSVLCDGDHLWQVSTTGNRFSPAGSRTLPTDLLAQQLQLATSDTYFVPVVQPVEFDVVDAPSLPPYFMGALLNAGRFSGPSIRVSVRSGHTLALLKTFLPQGTRFGAAQNTGSTINASVVRDGATARNPVVAAMKTLGLAGCRTTEKFVPSSYLFASVHDRLMLLRGILDGSAQTGNTTWYATTSPRFADNVAHVVRSLGGVADVTKHKTAHTTVYRISIVMPGTMNPFLLPHKAQRWQDQQNEQTGPARSITSIKPAGHTNITCIAVDAPDHLYVTDDFIVTHNTVQAIGTIHAADAYPAVIVCPATLKRNWEREFNNAVDGKNVVIVDGRTPVDLTDADVVIVNYDVLRHHLASLQELGPQAAVFDESHYVKNSKAARTAAALALTDEIPANGYVLALSGTPVTNKTAEFVTQLQLLGQLESVAPKPSNPVGSFLYRYCGPEPSGYQNTFTYNGASNSEELQKKLRARCYVRRQKEDVLKDLPKKTRQTTLIELEGDNLAQYRAAEKDFSAFIADRLITTLREQRKQENRDNADPDTDADYAQYSIDDIVDALDGSNDKYRKMGFRNKEEFNTWTKAALKASAGEAIAKTATLRKELGKAKIPAAIERIDEFQASTGRKLVVFAHHTDVTDTLANHYNAPKISGSVKLEDRQKAVDSFQNDPNVTIIICNDKAAAEGITLTAASDVLMVEQDWSPMDQAEARVDRIGQTQPVTIHYLLASGTIDEKIHGLVEKKRAVINAATDGITPTENQNNDIDAILNFINT